MADRHLGRIGAARPEGAAPGSGRGGRGGRGGGTMIEALRNFISGSTFMPHGHCYLWQPAMVWLQVITNTAIGLAYVVISTLMLRLVMRVRELPFQWIYLAFGVFIVSCGLTHFMDVVVIWRPVYWLDGLIRALTAVASVGTAMCLPGVLPKIRRVAQAARAARERGIMLETAVQDLEQMYRRACAAEELKARFFANVSHELRTPLTLILGPIEQLAGRDDLDDEARFAIEVMGRNAGLLLAHVNALLDLAKLDDLDIAPRYAQGDLAALLRRLVGCFAADALAREVTWTLEAPASLEAQFDPEKVERVVLNLLGNANKFTPRGGHIRGRLRLDAAAKMAVLEVADSGPGVPAADRATIFDRFAQAAAGTAAGGGTGLGLAIVAEMVRLHGGTIAVDASDLGGAAFTVRLPLRTPPAQVHAGAAAAAPGGADQTGSSTAVLGLVEAGMAPAAGSGPLGAGTALVAGFGRLGARAAPAASDTRGAGTAAPGALGAGTAPPAAGLPVAGTALAAPAPGPAPGPAGAGPGTLPAAGPGPSGAAGVDLGRPPTVLVVEDNPDVREMVAAGLRDRCAVHVAADGVAGLAMARAVVPDLIVSDWTMPGMTGPELVAALQAEPALADIPVMLLTAQAHEADRVSMLARGVRDYLAKPFSLAELRARVANLVEMGRARQILQATLSSRSLAVDELAARLRDRTAALDDACATARAAQAAAEDLSRSKQDFLNLVSHELRTPLTALDLQGRRLTRQLTVGPARSLVEQMLGASSRLRGLVESLLTYSASQQRRMQPEPCAIEVPALLVDQVAKAMPAAQARQVDVVLETPSALPLRSDPTLVGLIVTNLLDNAIKFVATGGRVSVRAEATADGVRIEVADNGPGIPLEHRARVFAPFVHLEPLAHKHTAGVGLGLALVREATSVLGGRVELAEPDADGCGTTFCVYLPSLA